jgi:hypothetical protein
MSSGIRIRFAVSEQTLLLKGNQEQFISAELIQGPADVIPVGTINTHYFSNYAQSAVNSLKVINSNIVATGRTEESDDNYRFRFINGLRSFPKTTTAGIFDVLTDNPEISYIIIDPSHNGGGTFAVYVQSVYPMTPDSLISSVYDVAGLFIPPWVNYSILKPNYIGLEMDITLTMSNPDSYISNNGFMDLVKNEISTYVNNFIGDTFYLYNITKNVANISSDVLRAEFNSINIYKGLDNFRYATAVDLTTANDPTITFSNIEKLVIEPLVSSIVIRIQ